LDDKLQLRYAEAGLTISNCLSLNQSGNEADLNATIALQQSVWFEGFELEICIKGDAVLPEALFNQLKVKLDVEKPDWEVSNEPVINFKISVDANLLMLPETTLDDLGELVTLIAEDLSLVIGEVETYNQTYNEAAQKEKP
jgi:hypothetical protein